MKVLVVGSLPPPSGGHRSSLLTEVLRRRESGDVVTVVGLDHLSASHRYLPGPGLAGVASIAFEARRHNALVIQLEPGLPVRARATSVERAVCLMALARSLQRFSDVTLRLHDLADLPGGVRSNAARALFDSAQQVHAGGQHVFDTLASFVPAEKLVLVGGDDASREPAFAEEWQVPAVSSASEIMSIVRERAAAERQRLASGRRPAASAKGRYEETESAHQVRVPQWEWLPAPGAGVPRFNGARGAPPAANPIRRFADRSIERAGKRAITRLPMDLARSWYRSLKRSVKGLSATKGD